LKQAAFVYQTSSVPKWYSVQVSDLPSGRQAQGCPTQLQLPVQKSASLLSKIPTIQTFKNGLPFVDETIQCKKYINITFICRRGNTSRWTGEYNTCS
jgi:hypothetical protein